MNILFLRTVKYIFLNHAVSDFTLFYLMLAMINHDKDKIYEHDVFLFISTNENSNYPLSFCSSIQDKR